MAGAALLARLNEAGLYVFRNGDRLIVVPRDRLTSELREAIRNGKRELLESLPATTISSPPPDQSLLDRIRAMAQRWGYSTEELSEELAFAAANPAASLRWVELDESQWVDCVFRYRGALN